MTYFISLDSFFSVLDSSFLFFNYLRVGFNKIYIPVAKTCNCKPFIHWMEIALSNIFYCSGIIEGLFQDQSGVMFGIMVLVALRLC